MAGLELDDRIHTLTIMGGMEELVRGEERALLERLEPLVRRENVELDLNTVERIDAAGLAALITLYCEAQKAGHEFTIVRPQKHVREILKLVGLEAILTSRPETLCGQGRALGQTAA